MKLNIISQLVENKIQIQRKKKYVCIIGSNPSKGARSPKLWNAAFKKHKINMNMFPFDVKKKNLHLLLEKLDQDKNFLGGSVAVPYKEDIYKFLGNRIDKTVKNIGSINCLYRDKKKKKIFGYNSDGFGALYCLKKRLDNNIGKLNIIILGLGGAGKSIAAILDKNVITNEISVYVRNLKKYKKYSKKFNFNLYPFPIQERSLKKCNVLINTTTVGSTNNKKKTILNENEIKKLKKNCFIFDIIYQPLKTELINLSKKNNLKTTNGLFMNLEQAVIAFHKTISFVKNKKITRLAMNNE